MGKDTLRGKGWGDGDRVGGGHGARGWRIWKRLVRRARGGGRAGGGYRGGKRVVCRLWRPCTAVRAAPSWVGLMNLKKCRGTGTVCGAGRYVVL